MGLLQGTPPPVNPPSLRHNICVTGDSYRVIAQPPVAKLKPCRLGGLTGGTAPCVVFMRGLDSAVFPSLLRGRLFLYVATESCLEVVS